MSQRVLRTPVPIAQNEQEFAALLDLYGERSPKRVLEIGTWHGGTLYHWLREASPGALVVSIDLWHDPASVRRFRAWIPAGVRLTLLSGRSTDPDVVLGAMKLGPFDWIFIDADHTSAAVREDWRVYRPLAASGGVIAFHDITETDDPTIEVAPLWREIRTEYETTEFRFEEGRWGIGVVFLPSA